MQPIYQVTFVNTAELTSRVEQVKARDVYDAHKQSYFHLTETYEEVSSIVTEEGQEVFSESEGFLEEQIF
jgi:hypothetical protein